MAINIDENLLAELGLGNLPPAEKDSLLRQIRETLEMRVGTRIAADLSDSQLKEFEQFMDKQDEAGAMAWLGNNYPSYKEVVKTELTKLRAEIEHDAPAIRQSLETDSKE